MKLKQKNHNLLNIIISISHLKKQVHTQLVSMIKKLSIKSHKLKKELKFNSEKMKSNFTEINKNNINLIKAKTKRLMIMDQMIIFNQLFLNQTWTHQKLNRKEINFP